jgi:transposase
MPESMHKKAYQRYTQEFKEQAISLLNLGKPVAEVAQELEVSSSVLYEWRQKAQGTQGGSAGLRAAGEQSEADALRALRRQVARLQAENDILKKAAIILGTKTPGNSAP